MSFCSKDILLANDEDLQELLANPHLPINLIESLTDKTIYKLTSEDTDSQFGSKYACLNKEIITGSQLNQRLKEQCLSIIAERHIVFLQKISDGDIASTLDYYEKAKSAISELSEGYQRWTIILVLEKDLSPDSIRKLLKTQDRDGRKTRPAIYLLGEKLNKNEAGGFVYASEVWTHAVPPLLSRLHINQSDDLNDSGIFAWKSMVLEPSISDLNLNSDLGNYIKQKLIKTDEVTSDADFEVPTLPDPELESLQKEIKKAIEEAKQKADSQANPKEDAATIKSLILKPWQPKKIFKKTDKLIRTAGLSEVGEAKNKVAKLHNRQRNDATTVDKETKEAWSKVKQTPKILNKATDLISGEMKELNNVIVKSNAWKDLLDNLKKAAQSKKEALEAAKILELARSFYISFNLRLGLAFVTILVVFYITFVVLYPVMSFFGLSTTSFWFAVSMGLAGVISALFLTYTQESFALLHGASRVDERINIAKSKSGAQYAFNFTIETLKGVRRSSWLHGLAKISRKVDRLNKVFSGSTDFVANDLKKKASCSLQEDGVDALAVTKSYMDSLYLWNIFKSRITSTNKEHEQKEDAEKKKLIKNLIESWKKLASCDSESNGYYPVDLVEKKWKDSLYVAIMDYDNEIVKSFIELLKTTNTTDKNLVPESILRVNGIGEGDYSFMSTEDRREYTNGQVYFYFKDVTLYELIRENYKTLSSKGRPNANEDLHPSFSYYGLVLEEVSIKDQLIKGAQYDC